jgi:hypothetical protein
MGFEVHPAMIATGALRPGSVERDIRVGHSTVFGDDELRITDRIDQAVRSSSRGIDTAMMVADPGCHLRLM